MEIREAMEKAAETATETTSSTPAPEVVETTTTAEPVAAEAAPVEKAETRARREYVRAEDGKFAKAAAEKAAAEKAAAASKGGANGAVSAAPPAAEGTADGAGLPPPVPSAKPDEPKEPLRAPQSLKPGAREKWSAVPREVQEDIVRREKETTQALQHAAEARKEADLFRQVVGPYEQLIRSSGATHPLQVVQNLLATASVLRNGSEVEKARMGARILKDFGINVELLAAELDGQPAQGRAAPAVDPVAIAQQAEQRIMANLRAEGQRRQQARLDATVAAVREGCEFWDDVGGEAAVREVAASLLAAGRAKAPEDALKKAYNLLVQDDPALAAIVKQREAAKAAPTAQAATARAQAAASSVRSTPAVAPARTTQPKNIREAMEAADAQLSGRV